MEGMFRPDGLAMRVMNWLTDMCHIQLLWLLYSLRGGLLLGVFPATRAMFYVQRQLILKQRQGALAQEFKQAYHQQFKRANQMGYAMLGLGGLLFLYLQSTLRLTSDLAFYFVMLAYGLLVFYVLVNLYMLVMLAHLTIAERSLWKQALLVVFLSPVHSLVIILLLFALLYMARLLPVLMPVVLVAIFSYFVSYVALHAITKIICRYQ